MRKGFDGLALSQEVGWMICVRVTVFTHTLMETFTMVNGYLIKGDVAIELCVSTAYPFSVI